MKKGLVTIQLGKNGLTAHFIEGLGKTFKNRKVVKVSLLRSYSRDKEEIKNTAEDICAGLKGRFKYKIIGFTIILKKLLK